MGIQRKMFEEWVTKGGIYELPATDPFGNYLHNATQCAWQAWKAAQQQQWQPTTKLPKRYEEVIVYPPPSEYCNTAQYGQLIDGSCDGWYYAEYERGYGVVFHECHPTHWMPLPQEPNK